jgi:hypothetical protein
MPVRCIFYGGPDDGAEHEIGAPLPPEVLMPCRPAQNLHVYSTPSEALALAGDGIERVRYWLARHALTGNPIYVLADLIERGHR